MHDFGSFTYTAAADHQRRRDVGIAEMANVWDNHLIRGRCLRFVSTLAALPHAGWSRSKPNGVPFDQGVLR